MNRASYKSVISVSLMAIIGSLNGAEEQYPMPETYSQSLIMGKTLRNPFAAKLRISQSRMKDLVGGDATKVETDLSESLVLGTTMYFGDGSVHNRAIINGSVRRPGDTLVLHGRPGIVATVKAIRPHKVTVEHRDPQSSKVITMTLTATKSRKPTIKKESS